MAPRSGRVARAGAGRGTGCTAVPAAGRTRAQLHHLPWPRSRAGTQQPAARGRQPDGPAEGAQRDRRNGLPEECAHADRRGRSGGLPGAGTGHGQPARHGQSALDPGVRQPECRRSVAGTPGRAAEPGCRRLAPGHAAGDRRRLHARARLPGTARTRNALFGPHSCASRSRWYGDRRAALGGGCRLVPPGYRAGGRGEGGSRGGAVSGQAGRWSCFFARREANPSSGRSSASAQGVRSATSACPARYTARCPAIYGTSRRPTCTTRFFASAVGTANDLATAAPGDAELVGEGTVRAIHHGHWQWRSGRLVAGPARSGTGGPGPVGTGGARAGSSVRLVHVTDPSTPLSSGPPTITVLIRLNSHGANSASICLPSFSTTRKPISSFRQPELPVRCQARRPPPARQRRHRGHRGARHGASPPAVGATTIPHPQQQRRWTR